MPSKLRMYTVQYATDKTKNGIIISDDTTTGHFSYAYHITEDRKIVLGSKMHAVEQTKKSHSKKMNPLSAKLCAKLPNTIAKNIYLPFTYTSQFGMDMGRKMARKMLANRKNTYFYAPICKKHWFFAFSYVASAHYNRSKHTKTKTKTRNGWMKSTCFSLYSLLKLKKWLLGKSMYVILNVIILLFAESSAS